MNYCRLLLLINGIFFLLVETLPAQDYRPVREGYSYEFEESSGNHAVVSVDDADVVNGDSVFFFDETVEGLSNSPVFNCGGQELYPQYEIEKYGILGKSMIQGFGSWTLLAPGYPIDSLTIFTNVSAGASWYLADTSYKATVISKQLEVFLGTQDTVITVDIDSKDTIKIAANHGLVKTVDFRDYFMGKQSATPYDLRAIPEIALGNELPDWEEIFDFQPGDEIGYFTQVSQNFGPKLSEVHKTLTVISKSESSNKDTIIVKLVEDVYGVYFDASGNPYDTIVNMGDSVVWRYTEEEYNNLELRPGEFKPDSHGVAIRLKSRSESVPKWGNRVQYSVESNLWLDTCMNRLNRVPGSYQEEYYLEGLGLVYSFSVGSVVSETELTCYSKGGSSWGTCFDFSKVVGRSELRQEENLQIYPNPASSGYFRFEGPAQADVRIFNLSGKLLLEKNGIRSDRQISVSGFQPGVYIIEISAGNSVQRKKLLIQ